MIMRNALHWTGRDGMTLPIEADDYHIDARQPFKNLWTLFTFYNISQNFR